MAAIRKKWGRFLRFFDTNEGGAALEYALVAGVIAVAVAAALLAFSEVVEKALEAIGKRVAKP